MEFETGALEDHKQGFYDGWEGKPKRAKASATYKSAYENAKKRRVEWNFSEDRYQEYLRNKKGGAT